MRAPFSLVLVLVSLTLALAGCQKVAVRPYGELPVALIVPTPAKVGVVVTPEAANYTHKETRANVDYEAELGPSHRQLVEEIFRAEFAEAKIFDSIDAARVEPGLLAIFEPRIEQFSFANAKETGGSYCAVTIRYQIRMYAPNGELVDTLTLTGYGSGPAPQIGNGQDELAIAAYAAMRDAAAKFLTQFQGLDVAKPLLVSNPLQPASAPEPGSPEALAAAAQISIEAVPINDDPPAATTSVPQASPAPQPQAPPDSPQPSQMAVPAPAAAP